MQVSTAINPQPVNSLPQSTKAPCYPMLGLVSTVVGAGLSIGFIPANPGPRGALFLPSLMMVIGLAIAPVAAAIRDPKALLRGEHLLVLAPIYWLLFDLLQGSYSMGTIQRGEVGMAFAAIGVFVSAVWISAFFRAWKAPGAIVRTVSREFSPNIYFALTVAAFVIGILKFAVACDFDPATMFYYVGQMRWAAPWVRDSLGGWDAFLDHMQYFGYLLPALTVVLARRAGWRNWRTVAAFALTLVMAMFLAQDGGRRIIGVTFGTAIVLWILTQPKIRVRHVVIVGVAAACVLAVMQLMLEYRDVGLAALTDDETSAEVYKPDSIRVDDNFYRLCQIINFIPQSHPYVYEKYVVYVLVRPIPRVFWPGKPEDPGFDLAAALGDKNVSYSSSVIGELFMSAGFFGIALGGWLYGRLSSMADQLLTETTTMGGYLVYSAMVMALFAGMRSMVELVLMNYVVLAWTLLSWLYLRFKRRRGRRYSARHEFATR